MQTGTFDRFNRSLHLKFHFAGLDNDGDDDDANEDYNPRMYIPSNWTPPAWTYPHQMKSRVEAFQKTLKKVFRPRRGKPNLLPHQQRTLDDLQSQNTFLIVPCDKNLGPSIIEWDKYIKLAMTDHLRDRRTYKKLTQGQQTNAHTRIAKSIEEWIKKYKVNLSKPIRKFLRTNLKDNTDPWARFYLTLKVHKFTNGRPLTSRPIVSCPGSLLHPLGIWVDCQLQKVAKLQCSYFKSSFDLKQQLLDLDIPPFHAKLFTADAVSMYTNIPTPWALHSIGRHLRDHAHDYPDVPAQATIDALRIVMKNNIFTFGDLVLQQVNGTAMGTPPAPPFATIYYALYENTFLDGYPQRLLFYRRFIDDVFGIWLCHPDPAIDALQWQLFQDDMNRARGLTWEFSERSLSVDFMDLTISLHEGRITTSLYEKPLNLHLYIPPHSAHPPGLLPGVVYGTLFRIHTLCTDETDKLQRTRTFFRRLKARGYLPSKIMPLFRQAIERAKTYTGPTNNQETRDPFVIFHLQYHPNDPPSTTIQRAWREHIATPQYKMPLHNITNPKSHQKCNVKRMIIAYKRPMNLGNMLTHRNLAHDNGPLVSSYYD